MAKVIPSESLRAICWSASCTHLRRLSISLCGSVLRGAHSTGFFLRPFFGAWSSVCQRCVAQDGAELLVASATDDAQDNKENTTQKEAPVIPTHCAAPGSAESLVSDVRPDSEKWWGDDVLRRASTRCSRQRSPLSKSLRPRTRRSKNSLVRSSPSPVALRSLLNPPEPCPDRGLSAERGRRRGTRRPPAQEGDQGPPPEPRAAL